MPLFYDIEDKKTRSFQLRRGGRVWVHLQRSGVGLRRSNKINRLGVTMVIAHRRVNGVFGGFLWPSLEFGRGMAPPMIRN
jgi:hypothetical protein